MSLRGILQHHRSHFRNKPYKRLQHRKKQRNVLYRCCMFVLVTSLQNLRSVCDWAKTKHRGSATHVHCFCKCLSAADEICAGITPRRSSCISWPSRACQTFTTVPASDAEATSVLPGPRLANDLGWEVDESVPNNRHKRGRPRNTTKTFKSETLYPSVTLEKRVSDDI